MDIIYANFPEVVMEWYDPHYDGYQDGTCLKVAHKPGWWMSALDTLSSLGLLVALLKFLDLPERYKIFIDIRHLQDGHGRSDFGLIIGNNYMGTLDEEAHDRLKAIISPNEDAKWYIDYQRWKWGRVSPKPTSMHNQ